MILTAEKKKLLCYHCGDICPDKSAIIEDKCFCCQGCKTVYDILLGSDLCDYYSLQESPGTKAPAVQQKYAFLEEERIAEGLLNFKDGFSCGVTFYIPSVHCSSCIWLLENLHKIQPGILHSSIQFQKKELELQFDSEKVSLAQVVYLLNSIGYAPDITLEGKRMTQSSVNKTLLYKIGIAGFCFGNIMLLSLPEYLSFLQDFSADFKTFFSYLNLLLTLPVFFYCAADYFHSSWNAIKHRMINIDLPIAMGLIAAFSQSMLELISHTGTGYFDSLTGLIFFLLIGKWYQRKTYEAISFQRDYQSYFPLAATRIKNGTELFVPLKELKQGDVIRIRNSDVIPADGILLKGEACIDYSFVTGESLPVSRNAGERLYAGGRQTGTFIDITLLKEVSESYLVQLWNNDKSLPQTTSGMTAFTNRVGKWFTAMVLILASCTYLFWYVTDSSKALQAAVSVLIIFCPCTLALALPFCFGNAMNRMRRNGFFLKNTSVLEKIADIDTIVFDKTGTITNAGDAHIEFMGALSEEETQQVKSLVVHSVHPLSRLIALHLKDTDIQPVSGFSETVSKGISGKAGEATLSIGSGEFTGTNPFLSSELNATRVYVRINDVVKGCYIFRNTYRTGIPTMLSTLRKSYDLHILSGDNSAERNTLEQWVPSGSIHFNQSPEDKRRYIQGLEQRHCTMMIGDGLNDAGALQQSYCGISVSDSGTHFSPACDAILEAGYIEKLPRLLAYAKACVKTVQISLLISLTYNIAGLFFACQGLLNPLTAAVLMPLSSVSIVLFVTVTSSLLAKRYRLD